jgi:hypothetical protein
MVSVRSSGSSVDYTALHPGREYSSKNDFICCLSNYADFNLSIYYKMSKDVSSLPVFFLDYDCIWGVWGEGLMGLEWNDEFEGERRETFDTGDEFAGFPFLMYQTT